MVHVSKLPFLSGVKIARRFYSVTHLFPLLLTLFLVLISTSQANAQPSTRPNIEGYNNYFGSISKDPTRAAELACDFRSWSGHENYLYEPVTPGYTHPDWPHPFPQVYHYVCAWDDEEGNPNFWHPRSSFMRWESYSNRGLNQQNQAPDCMGNASAGNPITLGFGEKVQTEVDFIAQGSSPLQFKRYYNSGAVQSSRVGSFGDHWSHTYDRRIVFGSRATDEHPFISHWEQKGFRWLMVSAIPETLPSTPPDYAYVVRSNGKSFYYRNTTEGWATDYGTQSVLVYSDVDQTWAFTGADNVIERYDAFGRLITIEDQGKIQSLSYNVTSLAGGDDNPETLDRIEDQQGNYLLIKYNDASHINEVEVSNGDKYQYTYSDREQLETVTYPNTLSRQYHYQLFRYSHLLTGITDERGVRYVTWEYDDDGRATT